MLHPVGPLPAAVYWRRRALVLVLLLAVAGGGGWLAVVGAHRWHASGSPVPAAATTPIPRPALDRVLPAGTNAAGLSAAPALPTCADAALDVAVRGPASAAVGSRPALELTVTSTSAAPCSRDLGPGEREIVLLDARGTRLWSSADCAPDAATDVRTLAPRQAVSLPVAWDGLTSDPTCAGPRVVPPSGRYVLRARVGTRNSPDTPLVLG